MGTQTTTSNAFETFKRNLEYIDHLLNAREALLKFEQIKPKIDLLNESSNTKGLGGISKIVDKASEILNNIDSEPSRGKREFSPINISAYTLLVSIFQGFIDNLYYEKGKAKLGNLSEDEKYKILKDMKPQRVNPHYDVIQKMFCMIGYYNVLTNISWKKCDNKTIAGKLTKAIKKRNNISHGDTSEKVLKKDVSDLKNFLLTLAENLDAKVR